LTQESVKAVVYRLQEGSLGVAQEGAKSVLYWLQEGSPVATQEGVNGVVCWPQEGGLVVVQVGSDGLPVGFLCRQRSLMVGRWVVSSADGPPTSGLVAERSTWRYDGRPRGMPLKTFEDRLQAEFFKQEAKGAGGKHKLTMPVFLQQVPSWLDHEALEVWRERKGEVLAEPAAEEAGKSTVEWDPIGKLVQIFRQEFQKASAEMVVEILQLKRQPQETCRMLKARVKRLSRETGLLNELEHARKFVCALEALLRAQVEPVL
jgi:hypothetical protein